MADTEVMANRAPALQTPSTKSTPPFTHGILGLPVEIKLQILLECNFFSNSLFHLTAAIPSFQKVYTRHERIIQRHIQSRDFSLQAVQLLGRFRCNEDGMGYFSLEIFANIHSWMAEGGNPRKGPWERFIDGREMQERRKKFGRRNGVVSNCHEVEFLMEIEKFVSFLYGYERSYGRRPVYTDKSGWLKPRKHLEEDGTDRRWFASEEDETDEVKARATNAIFHFLISTTYHHDCFLAIEGPWSREDLEERRRRNWFKWSEMWERRCRKPCYDFMGQADDLLYLSRLSIRELATIICVAKPIASNLYKQSLDRLDSPWSIEHFEVYLAYRCGVEVYQYPKEAIDPQAIYRERHTGDLLDTGDRDLTKDNRLYVAYVEAIDTGCWDDNYEEKLRNLEETVDMLFKGWTTEKYQPGPFKEQVCFTTVGASDEGGWDSGCGVVARKMLVDFSFYLD